MKKFCESELDEALQSLYGQGRFAEGEELCFDILRAVIPGWETARLFLLLNFAAQDAEVEALEIIESLSDMALTETKRLLDSGHGTEAERIVCGRIECYLSTPARPQPNEGKISPAIGHTTALKRVARIIREARHPCASKKSD